MRLFSRIAPLLLLLLIVSLVAACSSGSDAPTGTAAEIANKVFAEAGVEPFGEPMALASEQDIEYFLGSTNYPEFEDTAVVQPMISIDTRILYILKVADENDAAAVMKQLEIDVDPTRLICVVFSMEDVAMSDRGNVVFMVIDSNHEERNALESAFEAID